jgi:isopentenyldiphosphate isomerase
VDDERRESDAAADEIVALFDESNAVIGSAPRSVVRAQNLRHGCVAVIVLNSAGQIYVHRRTETKDVYPGCYDMMAGGVLQAGENPRAAAAREAEEELGVTGVEVVPLAEADYADDRSRYHAYGYTVTYDGPIRWQAEEVMWGEWMSPDELLAMVDDPDVSFAPDTLSFLRSWIRNGLLWTSR